MSNLYSIVVYGEPVPQGRPRFRHMGARVIAYDPKKCRLYKEAVKDEARLSIAKEHSNEAEELMDIITVCTGRLAAIGYDTAKKWHELAIKVNKKNGERGYFDD